MDTRRRDSTDDFALPVGTLIEPAGPAREAARERTGTRLERPARAPALSTAAPFRPTRRPPMALLTVYDDGEDRGEVVRIRNTPFVIGRALGDLVIPHDEQMSSRHLEITRQPAKNGWRWALNDLDSTNGTFVRVSNIALRPGQELLLGGRRYRFELDGGPAPVNEHTQPWQITFSCFAASLVEMLPEGDGRRHPLDPPEQKVGRDPAQCPVAIDDPFLDPVHARFLRDERELWHLASSGTLNGCWLRIGKASVGTACHFQLGEQRFLLRGG